MYILLFLLWLALNGRITAEIVAFGVVIAAAVYWFMCRFLEYSHKSDIRFFKNFFRTLQYMFVLLVEIVKSSFAVIKIVFSKKLDIQPQIVFFDVPLKSEFLRTILANSITLTPGTITVDLDENHFCIHALDYTLADGIEDSVFVHLLMKMEESYND
ncbi:MAG: Na+/H+ antiporter subunit E [Oscillospiraceae bacterium]|nr:Na+/H+ antiporter subunit E [Oscillospiraceae bacterium]